MHVGQIKKHSSSIVELRTKYSNIGKKWKPEEDDKLKRFYNAENFSNDGQFNEFIDRLVREFGRAPGGLKARLAMHFNDVPGWDYGRDEYRQKELDARTLEAIPEEKNEFLKNEYKTYVENRTETYVGFVKRVGELLGGVKAGLLGNRLKQLVGDIVKYKRDEVRGGLSLRREKGKKAEPEILQANFSQNPEALEVLEILDKSGGNLFLTGEAGTGKSTLLKYFRFTTEKNVVVLAPTGVAALNVEGQTIHSFCNFGPDITLAKVKKLSPWSPKIKLLQKLHTVVIDEISMVRADLLDCVDKFLRLNGPVANLPFGGLQMVFIGDLYQLPPVEKGFDGDGQLLKNYASPYFFDSRAFGSAEFRYLQLQTVYRQTDQMFLSVLNAVRNNTVAEDYLTILNSRSLDSGVRFTFEKLAVYLTPTNQRARQVNNFFLERLSSPLHTYKGKAFGNFENRELPTDLELQVKIGAQVMMLNNDARKRWVNGTMGKVVNIQKDTEGLVVEESEEFAATSDLIIIELETGETVSVLPHTWEMFQFTLDKKTDKIDSRTTGTYTQYPFKLAWAVTIHKAQGKTFEKVYIDLASGTFAHGQLYVALSRCRTLEGLYLKRPIIPADIILDPRVVEFMNKL